YEYGNYGGSGGYDMMGDYGGVYGGDDYDGGMGLGGKLQSKVNSITLYTVINADSILFYKVDMAAGVAEDTIHIAVEWEVAWAVAWGVVVTLGPANTKE